MQAAEKPIQDVIKKENTFIIPPYQRPYTWDTENTIQLLGDIKDAIENKETEYFIGSIVTIEKERNSKYEIVDGQQRLTTLNVIFSALYSLVKLEKLKNHILDRLMDEEIFADPVVRKPRLQVRAQDADIFLRVIVNGENITDLSDLSDSQVNLVENRRAAINFLRGLKEKELTSFVEYLEKKVYIVFISASGFDSALRLFNVLNSRGVPLGNSDLIKSYLYGLVVDRPKFEQSWNDIEAAVGISDMDYFFGHLRTSILADKARTTLFTEIKSYLISKKISAEDFIKKSTESALLYKKIFTDQFPSQKSRKLIVSLKQVNHDDWIPPLVAFFSSENKSSEYTKEQFLSLLEKITYQMWVCGKYRDARNQFYYQLIRAIKGQAKETIEKVFSQNFNKELRKSLAEDAYGRGFAKAALLRIELEQQDECVERKFHGTITIEHVLPQSMSDKYWTDRFSDDEHIEWVHKLGNLTLLSGSKNSSAQNSSFAKKKAVFLERNKKVSFDLTKEICGFPEWTPAVVTRRHEELVNLALKIWKI